MHLGKPIILHLQLLRFILTLQVYYNPGRGLCLHVSTLHLLFKSKSLIYITKISNCKDSALSTASNSSHYLSTPQSTSPESPRTTHRKTSQSHSAKCKTSAQTNSTLNYSYSPTYSNSTSPTHPPTLSDYCCLLSNS